MCNRVKEGRDLAPLLRSQLAVFEHDLPRSQRAEPWRRRRWRRAFDIIAGTAIDRRRPSSCYQRVSPITRRPAPSSLPSSAVEEMSPMCRRWGLRWGWGGGVKPHGNFLSDEDFRIKLHYLWGSGLQPQLFTEDGVFFP